MKIAKLTMGATAFALGALALSATPGLAQGTIYQQGSGYYVELPPAGTDDRGNVFVAQPRERVIVSEEPMVREAPVVVREAPVVVREAPSRVIVREPAPVTEEVIVRDAPPFPAPAPRLLPSSDPYGPDCRTVERTSPTGIVQVSTLCN